MADTGIKFSKAAFERTRDAVRLVESAPWGNGRAPYEATPLGDNLINISGEEIPPFSICCVTAYGTKGEAHYLKVTKPGTTFRQTLRINGVNAIATPGVGFCAFAPAYIVRYDSGTPAYGEEWGPKPGQWTISKGFPGCRILGIFESDMKLAYVELLSPITTLLGKASGSITARSSTTPGSGSMEIWYNNAGTLTDAGFSDITVKNLSDTAVSSGEYIQVNWIEDNWWVVPRSTGSDETEVIEITGATVDGNCFWAGKVKTGNDDEGGCDPDYILSDGATCYVLVLNEDDGSFSGNYATLTVGDRFIGQKISTYSGTPVYAVRTGGAGSGGTLLFKGTLSGSGNAASSTATVGSLVSLTDGVTAPGGSVSADNYLNWAWSGGDGCIVIHNTVDDTWILLSVAWDVVTPVTNVAYSNPSETQVKQDHIGKANASPASPATIWTGGDCSP